jgi:hypothetical protein
MRLHEGPSRGTGHGPHGVSFEGAHGGDPSSGCDAAAQDRVGGEFDGGFVEGEVEPFDFAQDRLEGEGGDGRRGGEEEALEGGLMTVAEAVVEGFVLGVRGGGEGGFGLLVPRQCTVPISDHEGPGRFVTLNLFQGPAGHPLCRIRTGS